MTNVLWLLFSFRGRLDAARFTPWWALYAVPVFFAGFATGTTARGYLIRGVLALGYFLLTLVPLAALATKRLRDASAANPKFAFLLRRDPIANFGFKAALE